MKRTGKHLRDALHRNNSRRGNHAATVPVAAGKLPVPPA